MDISDAKTRNKQNKKGKKTP